MFLYRSKICKLTHTNKTHVEFLPALMYILFLDFIKYGDVNITTINKKNNRMISVQAIIIDVAPLY